LDKRHGENDHQQKRSKPWRKSVGLVFLCATQDLRKAVQARKATRSAPLLGCRGALALRQGVPFFAEREDCAEITAKYGNSCNFRMKYATIKGDGNQV